MADQLAIRMTTTGMKSEFLAHSLPPTQSSIESTRVVEYSPIAAINNANPTQLIEFSIPASAEEFIDLDETFISVTMSYEAKKIEGTTVTDLPQEKISPVNNLLHALFSKVELTIQGTNINPYSSYYPYRAYIEDLLGTSNETKNTYLSASGWLFDDTENFEGVSKKRGERFKMKKKFTLYGKLHLDLAGQDKLVLNGVSIKLSLQLNAPRFYFVSDEDAHVSVSISQIKLFVLKKKATAPQMELVERMLNHSSAKYCIRRCEIKELVIPKDTKQVSLDNVFSGALPSRIILGMVENDSVNGNIKKNPFFFQNFNLNHAIVTVNGEDVPKIPYTPDFKSGKFVREYVELFHSLGKLNPHPFCNLSLKEFENGHTFLSFNLTADGSDSSSGHLNPVKRGTLRIDLKFGDALTSVISVIVFAEFDGIISIDKNRNCSIIF